MNPSALRFILASLLVFFASSANASDELLVNSIGINHQRGVDVDVLENGNAVFVWTDESQSPDDASGNAIRARIFDAQGTPIKSDILVNTTTSGSQSVPRVAAIKSNTSNDAAFVVVWLDQSSYAATSGQHDVRARFLKADGTALNTPLDKDFVITPSSLSYAGMMDVAVSQLGRVLVAWQDDSGAHKNGPSDDTGNSAIRARSFDLAGNLAASHLVNVTTKNSQERPSVAALPDGAFVVAWQDAFGDSVTTGYVIKARTFNASGNPVGGEELISNVGNPPDTQVNISPRADNSVALVWMFGSSTLPGNKVNGLALRSKTLVAIKPGASFHEPILTTESNPTVIELADGELFAVSMAVSNAGSDTAGTSIWGRRINSAGVPIGKSFQINATVPGDQKNPRLAALADGRVVVAWDDLSESADEPSKSAVRACFVDPKAEKECSLPTPDANLTLMKELVGCNEDMNTGLLECDFEISLAADVTILGNDLTIADITNFPIVSLTSDFKGLTSTGCQITTISQQIAGLTYIGLTAPAYVLDACKPPAPFKIESGKPLKILSTVTFDPKLATASPLKNCVISQADDLIEYMTVPLLNDCTEVPVCKGAPPGLEFWGQYDTSATEPDSVGSLIPTNTVGASVIPTTVPGHINQMLSLTAPGYVEYAPVNPSPFGFRREGVPGPLDTGDFSVDFWIKMPAHSGRVAILDTRRVFSDKNGVLISSQNGNVHFQMREKNGQRDDWVAKPATGKINDGQWHFVAVTVDRDDPAGGVIYVDGVPATIAGGGSKTSFDPTAFKGKALGANNPLTIGRNRLNGENKQAFEIDEIEFFHRVLTAPEIADLYAAPKCK